MSKQEEIVLHEVGSYMGSLQRADLAQRIKLGDGPKHLGRAERKAALTPLVSSRWAGSITGETADVWERAKGNLFYQRHILRSQIRELERSLDSGLYDVKPWIAFRKRSRLANRRSRLERIERQIEEMKPSIAVGSRRFLNTRHNLSEAKRSEQSWRKHWEASRLFLSADGDKAYRLGNGLIQVDPYNGSLRIRLPEKFAHYKNTKDKAPYFQFESPVAFKHLTAEWEAQVEHASVGYKITHDADRGRWYLDASWAKPAQEQPELEQLQMGSTLGVDLNADHLAACVLDRHGNPVGSPMTVPFEPSSRSAGTRDGHLRHAITTLLKAAEQAGCLSITIEDLNFDDSRSQGRERHGLGLRSRAFRKTISGIPTARFRNRLAAMASAYGMPIIAVDPAYTSKWGAKFWQQPLDNQLPEEITRHHAAAIVIGRRGQGYRAVRRCGAHRVRPEDLPWNTTQHSPDGAALEALSVAGAGKDAHPLVQTDPDRKPAPLGEERDPSGLAQPFDLTHKPLKLAS